MAKHVKRISIQTIGVFLLLLGIAGVILPVLQGLVFLILGLAFLSIYSEWAKKSLRYVGSKHPKADTLVTKLEQWVLKIVGE